MLGKVGKLHVCESSYQNLVETSLNALMVQIWTALIVTLLLTVLKRQTPSKVPLVF